MIVDQEGEVTVKEGNSMMLSLVKNEQNPDDQSKSIRINVKKITLLKNFINQPIENVKFVTQKFVHVCYGKVIYSQRDAKIVRDKITDLDQ